MYKNGKFLLQYLPRYIDYVHAQSSYSILINIIRWIVSHGGFVNTTIVGLTALHTKNAVTDEAHLGWQAHFTRPSPTNYM